MLTTERLVRTTQVVRRVKQLHQNRCQVCGDSVSTPAGPYAEGAHIRPLGRPHDGPDVASNVICLCPNDHVRFDYGAITIADDLSVIVMDDGSVFGKLRTRPEHLVDPAHLAYHRSLFARK